MCDNVTVISYVNNMWGMESQTCNNITCRIWDFCTKNQLWVSAVHIPGTINTEADRQSRVLEYATEWKLNPQSVTKIIETHYIFIKKIHKKTLGLVKVTQNPPLSPDSMLYQA